MKLFDAKPSFAGGELSPLLSARIDMAQYAIGARVIENFIVLPQGGIVNRPGTTVLAYDRTYEAVRLVPFVFSEDDSRCLAFGDGIVDVYGYTGFVLRITGSPYRTQHLSKLRWLQSADVLYLLHPDVPVHTLSRYSSTDWRFEEVDFKYGPFLDMNTDETLQARVEVAWNPSDSTFLYTALMYYVSKPGADPEITTYFEEDDVGRQIKIEQKVKPDSGETILTTNWQYLGASGTLEYTGNFFGPYTWRTSGKWGGDVTIQVCDKDGWEGRDPTTPDLWDWRDFKSYSSINTDSGHENFSWSGDIDEYAYRFRAKIETPEGKCRFTWNYEGGMILRYFTITGLRHVNDYTVAVLDASDGIQAYIDMTSAWALSAFCDKLGYPSVAVFHQERLVLGGTRTSLQTLWMSQPASWHSFKESIPTEDDDSIIVTLASKQVNEIRGLASRGDLLILTSGGEWNAKAGAKSDVFTPASIVVTPSGYRGSEDVATLDVGNVALFVQRHGTTVRSLGYSLDVDGYASSDLSILSEHIFKDNPIVAWDYQQTPWSVIWCVLRSGIVAALTLQQEHQVVAWTRQTFPSGSVEDVCSIPGDSQDDVYFAIRRNNAVQVERLQRRRDLLSDLEFRDAGLYPVVSVLECLEWEQQVNGTMQGRHRHVPAVTFRIYRTVGLKAGVVNESNVRMDELQFPDALSPGPSPMPYTGDVRMVIPGGMARGARIRVENDRPAPVTLLGVFPEVEIHEG